MSQTPIFHGRSQSGHIFTLYGDLEKIKQRANILKTAPADCEDYGIDYCDKTPDSTERFTQEERDQDLADLQVVLDQIANSLMEVFIKLPRKKNGSLTKNRKVTLWRGHTFQHHWEDHYGYNAPELRLKAIDDYKAELQFNDAVESY